MIWVLLYFLIPVIGYVAWILLAPDPLVPHFDWVVDQDKTMTVLNLALVGLIGGMAWALWPVVLVLAVVALGVVGINRWALDVRERGDDRVRTEP